MKKKIEVISSIVVIILIISFFLFLDKTKVMSFPIISNLQDYVIEKLWTHGDTLVGERGSIYALGEDGKLDKFNIGTNKWEKIETPFIRRDRWAISKYLFVAFVSDKDMIEGKISLFSVPDLKILNTISIDKEQYHSPTLYTDKNGKYVAAVNWYRFGVFSVKNGEKIFEYEGKYIETIDWSQDSNRIIFSSVDESAGSKLNPVSFIYIYDLSSKTLEKICRGWGPKWGNDENKIIFHKSEFNDPYGGYLYEFNRKTGSEKLLIRGSHLFPYDYCFSPSGKNLLVAFPQKAFYVYHWPEWLTVVNYNKPDIRFIISSGLGLDERRFFWVDN